MIENLSEQLENTMLTEDPLADQVASVLKINPEQATEMVKGLGFSQYLELSKALEAGDEDMLADLLTMEEDANAFKAARTPDEPELPFDPMADKTGGAQAEPGLDFKTLAPGSQLNINNANARVKDVDQMAGNHGTTIGMQDGSEIEFRDRSAPPDMGDFTPGNEDEAMAEIERIKKLAGIQDDTVEEAGGALTCASKGQDGMSGPQTIVKRHRKKMRPGPKT